MARPRIKLTLDQENELRTRAGRGESAKTIATSLGLTESTVARRIEELRPEPKTEDFIQRVKDHVEVTVPIVPPTEFDPNTSSVEHCNLSLTALQRQIDQAEGQGNSALVANLLRTKNQILATRAKLTPITKPDPSENPDMKAAAARAAAKILALPERIAEALGISD